MFLLPTVATQTGPSVYAVTSHFIRRQVHRKSEYIGKTYLALCAVIELLLLMAIRKGQFAALLAILSMLFSPHKLCSYTKELL